MTSKKLPLGAYHTLTQTQPDGSEKVAAHVFAIDGDPASLQRNFALFTHAAALREHLQECLDVLYNETHGQDDSPYMLDVKKRCAEVLAATDTADKLKGELPP